MNLIFLCIILHNVIILYTCKQTLLENPGSFISFEFFRHLDEIGTTVNET